ncbi:MAG: YnfA family protein [Dehalococcoidia bacterium]|nr:YnfA family protein [Dehalococcoidia bacterium]
MVRALAVFFVAGCAEIGGGWLVWQWLREGRPLPIGLLGGLVLASYGVVATLQKEAEFGRVYAAYGGIFIALSLGWGVLVDGWRPDRWDVAGAAVAVLGMGIMLFAPRPS